MTDADLEAFTEALQSVAFVCTGRRVHDDLVAAYFRFLRDEPIGPLVRALERFGRTAETGRKFPSPREIREWMTTGPASGGLTADQDTRIRAYVAAAMDDWEREGKPGSARPTFELAWHSALVTEGLHGDVRAVQREAAWRRWLWHGTATSDATPIATRAQVKAILTQTLPRCAPVFAKALQDIADRIEGTREPGCDDDLED
jgi:hypothetical protein